MMFWIRRLNPSNGENKNECYRNEKGLEKQPFLKVDWAIDGVLCSGLPFNWLREGTKKNG